LGSELSGIERLLLQTGSGDDDIRNTKGTTDDYIDTGAGNDTLYGGAGNDTLDGGSGIDSMVGGAGADLYVVTSSGDAVTELSDEGIDLVKSSVSYTLGANVENLELTGTSNRSGNGNTLANIMTGNGGNNQLSGNDGNDTLYGGAGNDTLDGGSGSDSMVGGAGDDLYVVTSSGDAVTEQYEEGIDLVKSSVSWTLGANVENLELTGSSNRSGNGNTLANIITGNSGANKLSGNDGNDMLYGGAGSDTLDGGSGSDSMLGGSGDDLYIMTSSGDAVLELSDEGIDLVKSSVSYTLGANVENLELTGSSNRNGNGNTLTNIMTGNSGDNKLSGNDGNDTLYGGAGNDTLDGGSGSDSMVGGAGADLYVVTSSGDAVLEQYEEGIDLVKSSVSYTLGANVENLELTGTSNRNGTGNLLANIITGNIADNKLTGNDGNDTLSGGSGNDTLDGGNGSDSMVGGTGNDIYIVNTGSDVVTELDGEGTDLVRSSVSYTLGSYVENLELTGTSNRNGTGNLLANIITGNIADNKLTGNDGNDTLSGGDGNDSLIGGSGADILTGGIGHDLFIFNSVGDSGIVDGAWDEIMDFSSGMDQINLSGIDANTGISGNQAFSSVILGSTDSFTAAGQLRFDAATHVLYGNTDSDSDAEFGIKLSGVGSLNSSDIVL
ncbi:MAG: calcium-binding protein, partial [Chlorobiaceae bacterium]|nr:calcium-binding protein [Chlorobiaceae bacterium]